jgi:Asp-tRNA(Asn)/Glu-tRNA(Gln) amidotransferase A subunit family amidase
MRALDVPVLEGSRLRLATWLLESPVGQFLLPIVLREMGVAWLRRQPIDDPPTFAPRHAGGALHTRAAAVPQHEWPVAATPAADGFQFAAVHDYALAYRAGTTTPTDVAQRVLQAITESNETVPALRAMIAVQREDLLRQAEAASQRIRSGTALGVLDGVPIGVKDEVDMVPYPTTVGTAFLGRLGCTSDATVVARLRAAGALLIGKTNMHEIGIGVTGLNPIHGTPRNPYAPDRHTGGSSSGSAAAVAAGLCPLAIGADGGGSIRIPAALCGLVGLKPTYGRVSERGAVPLCWSVAHIGPIGATVADTALGYAVVAGPDPGDPGSLHQPLPTLAGWNEPDLRGVRLGVFWPWFRDADLDVVVVCEAMLGRLRERGAEVHEVSIPGLEAARVAHAVTISSEMAQAMSATYAQHGREHARDVRISLRIARATTALDYIQAQRVRTRILECFRRVLTTADAIVTPATAIAAPPIPDAGLRSGAWDVTVLGRLMRFATPANLTGLPAISFPAGYTSDGLPVGMQAIGRAWEEALLLRIARAAEGCLLRRPPVRHYRVLDTMPRPVRRGATETATTR